MREELLQKLPHALFEIGKAIGLRTDPDILLARVSEMSCSLTPATACSVMLLSQDRTKLLAKAAYGLNPSELKVCFNVGEGVAGWVAQHGTPLLIDDVLKDSRFVEKERAQAIRSMVSAPMNARGEVIGVLTATNESPGAFTKGDLDLLGFIANTIALDVQNIRLQRLSVTDALTGIFNREFLGRQLPEHLREAEKGQYPISIVMVDVDHFKSINDQYGHLVGDEVLKSVANCIGNAIRADDYVVRYGGEEFLVVLPRADVGRAWEIGERIRRQISEEQNLSQRTTVPVTISAGVAEHHYLESSAETAEALVLRADEALYLAKTRGRNRVEISA